MPQAYFSSQEEQEEEEEDPSLSLSSLTSPSHFVQITSSLPPGISLVSAPDYQEWQLDIQILDDNPIYLDQIFRLRFRFTKSYPIGTPNQGKKDILSLSAARKTDNHQADTILSEQKRPRSSSSAASVLPEASLCIRTSTRMGSSAWICWARRAGHRCRMWRACV